MVKPLSANDWPILNSTGFRKKNDFFYISNHITNKFLQIDKKKLKSALN